MAENLKQRLIVLNGQRILQNFTQAGWKTTGRIKRVEPGINPGIYNIYLSESAVTTNKKYGGLILFVDQENDSVFQEADKKFITHKLKSFKSIPVAGKTVIIQYENKRLNVMNCNENLS